MYFDIDGVVVEEGDEGADRGDDPVVVEVFDSGSHFLNANSCSCTDAARGRVQARNDGMNGMAIRNLNPIQLGPLTGLV